jgi:hypothetical protein
MLIRFWDCPMSLLKFPKEKEKWQMLLFPSAFVHREQSSLSRRNTWCGGQEVVGQVAELGFVGWWQE